MIINFFIVILMFYLHIYTKMGYFHW